MITPVQNDRLVRVTVTLDAADVDLLDRLAALEGLNRSSELRSMLGQLRPMLRQTVEAFEAASRQREAFEEQAARLAFEQLSALVPEVEKLGDAYLGAMSRLEGAAASAQGREADAGDADPRGSNHGGHTPTETDPTPTDDGGE